MTHRWLAIGVILFASTALEVRAELLAPELLWGPVVVGEGGSAYYLNDNVYAGNALGGRIDFGPYEQDRSGTVQNSLQVTGTAAAKSATRIGDYVYFTGNSSGVHRVQVANTATPWTTSMQCSGTDRMLETITSDGTYLYGSTTGAGGQIQAFSVNAETGALTEIWSTSGIEGRVRGLDWDASGYLYAVDGGGTTENAVNNSAILYAIAADTGAVTNMGVLTFNGRLYQTVREGNQIAVFNSYSGSEAAAGEMAVYDLASDTSLVSTTPVGVWDPEGIDRIYGAAIDNGVMWLAGANGVTCGYMVPEPSSCVLLLGGLVFGALCGLHRWRRAQ